MLNGVSIPLNLKSNQLDKMKNKKVSRLCILFSFLISIFPVSAQNTSNEIYKNKPNGKVEFYYLSGHLKSSCTVRNGKIHGERRGYYRTGELLNSEQFEDGFLDGPTITYNKNGDTTSIEMFRHDTLLLLKDYWFYKGKGLRIASETFLLKDTTLKVLPFDDRTGLFFSTRSHKKLIQSSNSTNTTTRFYRNGHKKSIVQYSNDDRTGVQMKFFKSGEIRIEANYQKNKLHGASNEYTKDGTVKKTRFYSEGKLVEDQ